MARREQIIQKIKKMSCGHEQVFSTPVPQENENVWCLTCNAAARIPRRNRKSSLTVAQGRPRRLKSNPRSNNQYTKGRELVDG